MRTDILVSLYDCSSHMVAALMDLAILTWLVRRDLTLFTCSNFILPHLMFREKPFNTGGEGSKILGELFSDLEGREGGLKFFQTSIFKLFFITPNVVYFRCNHVGLDILSEHATERGGVKPSSVVMGVCFSTLQTTFSQPPPPTSIKKLLPRWMNYWIIACHGITWWIGGSFKRWDWMNDWNCHVADWINDWNCHVGDWINSWIC